MGKQLFEVEIKSMALVREGKKGLIIYFRGGPHAKIVKQARILYPQYTATADNPVFNITPISFEEYQGRLKGGPIRQKQALVSTRAHVLKAEDYENLGN